MEQIWEQAIKQPTFVDFIACEQLESVGYYSCCNILFL